MTSDKLPHITSPARRPKPTPQTGFTLVELLVAVMIFAMLAVSGWQIMASISKSRDRANSQLQQLSQLQYAYIQLAQDFAQTVNYLAMPIGLSLSNASGISNSGMVQTPAMPSPTFVLTAEQVSFNRLASPDPRLNPPPAIARVVYRIDNGNLIKQRFYQPNNPNETPVSSVLLTGLQEATWQALTPETVTQFPDSQTLQQAQATAKVSNQGLASATAATVQLDLTAYQQLPKGVQLSFRYHDQPVVWRFALPNQAPTMDEPASTTASTPSPTSNPNSDPNLKAVPNMATPGSSVSQPVNTPTPSVAETESGSGRRPQDD